MALARVAYYSPEAQEKYDKELSDAIGRNCIQRRNFDLLLAHDMGADIVAATMDKIDDGDAVNLSTGIFTSFIDFARLAAELVGYRPVVRGMSDKPVGVHACGGDTSKQNALGFK